MTIWRALIELAASGLIGGFIGFLAAYMYEGFGKRKDFSRQYDLIPAWDALEKADYFEEEERILHNSVFIAAAVGSIAIRLILLVF